METPNFRFVEQGLGGLWLITPKRRHDARGWHCETHNDAEFASAGVPSEFVQENQTLSKVAGIVRGLHYSDPPVAKHVRVSHGRVFSVAVDLRPMSPSFGRWAGAELSLATGVQMLLPEGFAHGVAVLEPSTVLNWRISHPFDARAARGVRFDDADLAIEWPVDPAGATLSPRDAQLPTWRDVRPTL